MNIVDDWKNYNANDHAKTSTKRVEFIKALSKALEADENHYNGIAKYGDITRPTIKSHAEEMEDEGLVKFEKEGRKKKVYFTDGGKEYLEKLKQDLSRDLNLEKFLKDFQSTYLRLPTREELNLNYNGNVTDEKISSISINYVEPSEDAIKKQDEKLWFILSNTLRTDLESKSKFKQLIPINNNDNDTTSISKSNIESYIESQTKFDAETFLDNIDSETLAIKEEKQESYIRGKEGKLRYSRIHVKLPEPYYSYFGSEGRQYIKFLSKPEADPINFSKWENLKFNLKKYLPGKNKVRRLY